ncbi:MAG: DUF1653 domain-containing protein [Lachnospiraceae bacterium]|nr:DUF1653 domain-containing protein [Lachnospiraceae bacterium]
MKKDYVKGWTDMGNTPKPYEIYRHFKGNLYQIIAVAKDSEDGHDIVVYQALYHPFTIYARDLKMFMGPVDRSKYSANEYPQEMRFAPVTENTGEGFCAVQPANAEPAGRYAEEKKSENRSDASASSCVAQKTEVNPALMMFLDAENYEQKLDVLREVKGELTPEILTPIELSLGMEPQDGTVEERYRLVKTNLLTRQKYEKQRL